MQTSMIHQDTVFDRIKKFSERNIGYMCTLCVFLILGIFNFIYIQILLELFIIGSIVYFFIKTTQFFMTILGVQI